jgi:hypothetical protein
MLQRSPVIFWLLLAATLAVDAVVCSWVVPEPKFVPSGVYVVVTFLALILSQLSIVCIWSGVSSTKSVWTRFAPLIATVTATFVTTIFLRRPGTQSEILMSQLAYYGLHAALLLIAVWLLKRTTFWRRIGSESHEWQFSLGDSLIAMTVVALLAALMPRSWLLNSSASLNFLFVLSSVALAVESVVVWSLSWHWLLRLAGVLGFAALLGAVLLLLPSGRAFYAMIIGAHYLVQALVLSVWLGCGPILPHASVVDGT